MAEKKSPCARYEEAVERLQKEVADKKRLADQFMELSYDVRLPWEGWAEAVRLWTTQPDHVRAEAPDVAKYFENFERTNAKYGPALRSARADLTEFYQDSTAEERAASKVGGPSRVKGTAGPRAETVLQAVKKGRSIRGVLSSWAWEARFQIVDDLAHIYRAVGPEGYAYARVSRGASGVVRGAIKWGGLRLIKDKDGRLVPDYGGKSPSLNDIVKTVGRENLVDFLLYAVGRRAELLRQEGRENLFDRAEIAALVALGDLPGNAETFAKAGEMLQDWFGALAQFAEDAGVLRPEQRDQWLDWYFPFYRTIEPSAGYPKGQLGRLGGENVVKRLRGGEGDLRDPMDNLMRNAQLMVETSLRNLVVRDVVDGVNSLKGDAGRQFMVKLGKRPAKLGEVSTEEVKADIRRHLLDRLKGGRLSGPDFDRMVLALDSWAANKGETIETWRMISDPQRLPGERIVATMVDGQPVFYEVADRGLFDSLAMLKRPALGKSLDMWNRARQFFQQTVTTHPKFALRNIQRDTVSAFVYGKTGMVPFVSALRGAGRVLAEDPYYRELVAGGGQVASVGRDYDSSLKKLDEILDDTGWGRFTYKPKSWWDGLQKLIYATEMASRVEEHRLSRKQGESRTEAAVRGRLVSADFSLRGYSSFMRVLNSTIPFLGASIAGLDLAYGKLRRGTPGQRAAVVVKMAIWTSITAAAYLMFREHPMVEEAPDWLKNSATLVPVPKDRWIEAMLNDERVKPWEQMTLEEASEYWEIVPLQKAFEIGALSSAVERMIDGSAVEQPGTTGSVPGDVWRILMNNFRILGMPVGVSVLVEQWANRNAFTDAPIETVADLKRMGAFRGGAMTSPTLRQISDWTAGFEPEYQLSAPQVQHAWRGLFGSWGQTALGIVDAAVHTGRWTRVAKDVTGIGALEVPPGGTRSEQEFWELYKLGEKYHNSLERYARRAARHGSERTEADLETAAERAALFTPFREVADALRQFREAREQIEGDEDLSRAEKDEALDLLQLQRNDMMREIGPVVRELHKEFDL